MQIIHDPLGEENPYEYELYERQPHYPMGGDNIKLGILTKPGQQNISLIVELLSQDGETPHILQADIVSRCKKQDVWKVKLPKVIEGMSYKYRIKTMTKEGAVYSKYYEFETPRKASIVELIAVEKAKDSLKYIFKTNIEGFFVQSIFNLLVDSGLGWEWKVFKDKNKLQKLIKITKIIHFELSNFTVNYSIKEKTIWISSKVFNFKLEENGPTCFLIDKKNKIEKINQSFHSPNDEAFYGFGERFNSLNQRGNRLDNIVYNQYANQGSKTNLPIPYFLSSRGYGLYFNTRQNIIFDLAATEKETWNFTADLYEYDDLSFNLWVNPYLPKIQQEFIALSGKPKIPPDWVFGLWISANRWNNQKMVEEEINLNIQNHIPAKVVVLEAWSDEVTFCIWNDSVYPPRRGDEKYDYEKFEFPDNGHWPDPKGLCDAIHKKDMKLVIWQNPVIKGLQKSDEASGPQPQHVIDQEYASENKYCAMTQNSKPYQIPKDTWFMNSMLLDFSNPAAVEWWFDRREFMVKNIGVDGFKTDGGEHILGHNIQMKNVKNSRDIRNLYTNYYQEAYAKYLEKYKPGDWVLFSRSGYVGIQKVACHWAGDQQSSWENFRAIIFAGLSAGLSGIIFWGFDIGGFFDDLPSPDLYLRSTAMAALCPIMQYHSCESYASGIIDERTPWNIQKQTKDVDIIGIFSYFTNFRMNLMPYILNEARSSAESGLPMMRIPAVLYPEDMKLRDYPYQYFFGSDLLVAPVVNPDAQLWQVYLPQGDWYDFWTNELYEGGQLIEYPVPIDRIPLFVKAGSLLPLNLSNTLELGSDMSNSVSDFENLTLGIYLRDNRFSGEINLDENTPFQISGEFEQDSQTLKIQTGKLSRDLYIYIPVFKSVLLFLNDKEVLICKSRKELLNSKQSRLFYDSKKGCLFVKLLSSN